MFSLVGNFSICFWSAALGDETINSFAKAWWLLLYTKGEGLSRRVNPFWESYVFKEFQKYEIENNNKFIFFKLCHVVASDGGITASKVQCACNDSFELVTEPGKDIATQCVPRENAQVVSFKLFESIPSSFPAYSLSFPSKSQNWKVVSWHRLKAWTVQTALSRIRSEVILGKCHAVRTGGRGQVSSRLITLSLWL